MTIVVIVFFAYVVRFLIQLHSNGPGFFTKPFYDPARPAVPIIRASRLPI